MEKINDTTFKKDINDNPNSRIEIEIGDIQQENFFPQFKTKHWGNECNFSVRLNEDIVGSSFKEENGIVEWTKGNTKARLYKLEGFENGGFEFEIEFTQKPVSNIVEYTVQGKEFDYFYQGELTPEEIEKGSIRPENVIGSYAVYHRSKKNNIIGEKEYRTGKAFHIYRPFAVDANNDKVWCELNIENNLMTVTIPQDFLDNAVYPVIVDPTFGYTSIGATTDADTGFSILIITKFTLSETGAVSSISKYDGSNSGTVSQLAVIYSENSGSPDALIASGPQTLVDTTDQWNDLPVTITIPSGIYWIGFLGDTNYSSRYDAGGVNQTAFDAGNNNPIFFPTPPDPFSIDSLLSRVYSFYATYTAGPGNLKTYNTNTKANIKTINTNPIANVKTLNTNP